MAQKEEVKLVVTPEGILLSTAELKKLTGQITKSDTAAKKANKTLERRKKLSIGLGIAIAGLAVFFKKATKNASNLAETTNKFNTIFKGVEKKADSMAQTLIDSYGQSEESSRRLLASTGDLLTGLGVTADKAADMSFRVQTLSVDLASFQNLTGGAERASLALTGAMLGETERLKTLGIKLSETAIKERVRVNGLEKLTGRQLLAAKAEAVLQLAIEQSGNAIGDFNRTQFDMENVSRRVNARLTDQSAQLGKELVPSLAQLGVAYLEATKDGGVLMKAFQGLSSFISGTIDMFTKLINTIEGLSRSDKAEENLRLLKAEQHEERRLGKIIKDRFGTLTKARAAAKEGNTEAIDAINDYEGAIENTNKQLKETENSTRSLNEVATRLSDKEIENIKKVTAAREAAKARPGGKKRGTAAEEKKQLQAAKKAREAFLDFTLSAQEKEIAAENEKFDMALQFVKNDKAKKEELEKAHQKNLADIRDKAAKENRQKSLASVNQFLNASSQVAGQLSAIMSQFHSNQNAELDNQQTKEEEALITSFDRQQRAIENSTATEEQKNAQLKTLDEQRKRAEEALNNKFEKKRRKLAREQAKREKAAAIITATINTALAVTKAYSQGGFFGGPIFAAIVGALGAAQIALIASAPLPKAARGGLIKGTSTGTNLTAGEGGKSEAIIPLENEEALEPIREAGLGGGVNINIGTFNAMGNAEEMAVAFDREVYKLIRDGNSLIAEELST